MHVGEEV